MSDAYNHLTEEEQLAKNWDALGIYKFDQSKKREETFVIDTPPPTVSGSLHVGHVFSYTQTDLIARFHRMNGKNIYYPMGWDDNGLPTERRVQNYFNIKCDPSLPYDPDFKPEQAPDTKEKIAPKHVSRKNFIEACGILTKQDEAVFESIWRKLGLSIDWSLQYATIDDHCRKISQASFLDLLKKGFVYNVLAPTMWDVDFQSAVAQAEVEDREMPGAFHNVRFGIEGGGEIVIATTRPELIPCCIAVTAHPDDERYKHLFGKFALTPLFQAPLPILPSEKADPTKGTGIMMISTFGDIADVEWWKQSKLPLRQVVGFDGRMMAVDFNSHPFESRNPEKANEYYKNLQGLTIKQAQKKIVELLSQEDSFVDGKTRALIGEPKPISHAVKFFEKGDRPLEFVPTRQWFIKVVDHKDALKAQGDKITWRPEHMKHRFTNWVEGLNVDWCISRQRYFGIPFPVWYKIDADGQPLFNEPIFASEESLPVDPMHDIPQGYTVDQRGKPNGFLADPDVMDTWATSALTPQIATGWQYNKEKHSNLFPMDMRPQGHDIIRTWAFVTIAKAWMHEGVIPWKNAMINGWILDPERKKMSKSKGNVVTPEKILAESSVDAVRYWAARARLGADTAYEEALFKIGRKLSTKVFNATKFVWGQVERAGFDLSTWNVKNITEPLDLAQVKELKEVITKCTNSFINFDYAEALAVAEDSFWKFCDNYLELVKGRSYEETESAGRASALTTLVYCLKTYLKLFAPAMPYVTDSVWQWTFAKNDGEKKSIHISTWPKDSELDGIKLPEDFKSYDIAVQVLGLIRREKTEKQVSLKTPVQDLEIHCSSEEKDLLNGMLGDVLKAANFVGAAPKMVAAEAVSVNVSF